MKLQSAKLQLTNRLVKFLHGRFLLWVDGSESDDPIGMVVGNFRNKFVGDTGSFACCFRVPCEQDYTVDASVSVLFEHLFDRLQFY